MTGRLAMTGGLLLAAGLAAAGIVASDAPPGEAFGLAAFLTFVLTFVLAVVWGD